MRRPESALSLAMSEPARNDDGLPSLFGYAALERVYGWKRRQIENAMRDGLLTRPMYAGKRAYWTAEQIDSYLAKLRGARVREAVTTPDDIAPERIEHALDVLVERWARQRGIDLPEGSFLSVNVPLTGEQMATKKAEIADAAAVGLEGLANEVTAALSAAHYIEALLIQRALLPQLAVHADTSLAQFGVFVSLAEAEWTEVGFMLLLRLLRGARFDAKEQPAVVMRRLVDDGVLAPIGFAQT